MSAKASPTKGFRVSLSLLALLALLLAGPLLSLALGRASVTGDWRSASQRSSGLAPDLADHPEPIVQVYASRTFGWRGAFADHTWLVTKEAGATHYTRYEVIGWNSGSGRSVVSISSHRPPDAEWFGAPPRVIRDIRGSDAEAIIRKLPQAIAAYPYADTYHAWPGPNSNTFLAYLGRDLAELHLTLPSTAVGKDYLPLARAISTPPSGSGIQLSLFGILGFIAGPDEGLELNVLGLVTGIDFKRPALLLPGIGRVPGDG